MKRRLKHRLPPTLRRWTSILICLIFFLGVYGSFSWLIHADGSRNLYPAGATGNRANLEWRTSFYGNNFLRRRTLLKVYAEAGEVILLGSSAVGVDNGDVRVYNPGTVTGPIGDETIPGIPDFSCETQRGLTLNLDQGRIINRAQELAGPDTITETVTATPGFDIPNGYVPCFYPVPSTGIYNVVFLGPKGDNSDDQTAPTGEIDLSSPNNFDANQDTSVAAWDVTLRSALTATTDITGRLFANYLTLYTGTNPRPISSTLYILTIDGYIFRTNLRGLDPNAFIIYANNVGFLNSDGTPLYHDVVANPSGTTREQDQLNDPQGGVSLLRPTHLLFLEPPSDEAIMANGIPLTPINPVADSIVFKGNLKGNNSSIGAGGTFTYTRNVAGTFELIISRDGVDFDPTNPLNRVLYGVHPAGSQSVDWDGLDNAGNPFLVGTYSARMTARTGEYHFLLLDIENSLNGGPQFTLLNPAGGVCPSFAGNAANCNIAFYDDRGYTTANGTDVGTPGNVLPGNGPPTLDHSDPLAGFDTSTDQHRFGDGSINGFGDKKGLDLWTFVPSNPISSALNIVALNLIIDKTDGGITTTPGGVVTYTLAYTNTGPSDATGVVVSETVPANTTFNATASAPTVWSCPDGSAAGTTCTTNVGLVISNSTASLNFAVTVADPLPAGVDTITNTAVIGDDGASGPEPTGDNTASDTTPINIVDPRLTKIADVSEARPGDLVNFIITVSHPSPPANAAATNLTVTDALPLELDLVSFTVSSSPPGLVSSATVTTQTVSTVGHPSGVTQTVASTVTVDIPVLGVNEAVSLTLTTRVNNLASPAPLTITNLAVLDCNECIPSVEPDDDDTTEIPVPPDDPSLPLPPRRPPENPSDEPSLPDDPREDVPVDVSLPDDPREDVPVDVLLPVKQLPDTGRAEVPQSDKVAVALPLPTVGMVLFLLGITFAYGLLRFRRWSDAWRALKTLYLSLSRRQ